MVIDDGADGEAAPKANDAEEMMGCAVMVLAIDADCFIQACNLDYAQHAWRRSLLGALLRRQLKKNQMGYYYLVDVNLEMCSSGKGHWQVKEHLSACFLFGLRLRL